jgi:hypothetical protein
MTQKADRKFCGGPQVESPNKGGKGAITMAKNWKAGEAARAIKFGTTEEKLDVGRRFPLFAILVAISSATNDAVLELLDNVGEYVTARKVESGLKGEVAETAEATEEAEPEPEAKPVKKAAAPAKEEAPADKYAGKTPKELYDLCKKAGIEVETKQTADTYTKALKKHDAAKAKPAAKPAPKEEEWEDEKPAAAPAKKEKKAAAPAKEADDWDV